MQSIWNNSWRVLSACAAVLLALAANGCARRPTAGPASPAGPRVEDMSRGSIRVTLTANPAKVEWDKDLLLSIEITAPSEMDVHLPDTADRLQGFALGGTYDDEPSAADGKVTHRRHLRLTPAMGTEHRLAPMAIQYTDHSRSPALAGWFPTRPLVFDVTPPFAGKAGRDIEAELKPVWIYPPFKTVALWTLASLAALGALAAAGFLFKRVRRQIQLMRMSPKERALVELNELLARDLIAKDMVKEFYLELTLIVRRYVERRHTIRAPEQTTEEFLAAVSTDSRFSPDVVRRLKDFLEAADLVKFAAYRPPAASIDAATGTARVYIENDVDLPAGGADGKKG